MFNGNPHDCSNYNKNQEKFYQQLVDLINDRMCFNPPYVDKAEMGITCSGDHDNHIYHTYLCPEAEGTLHDKDEYVFDRCLDSRIWDKINFLRFLLWDISRSQRF